MMGFEAEMETRPDYEKILEQIHEVGFYEVEGPHYIVEEQQSEVQDEQ